MIGRHQAEQQAWGEAAGKAEGQHAGQRHRPAIDEGVAHPGDTEDRDDGAAPAGDRIPHRPAMEGGDAYGRRPVAKVKRKIRENTTPRHVPARVVQVPDIPRTKSGEIVDVAVRNVVHERPVKKVEAPANPKALEFFRNRAELAD